MVRVWMNEWMVEWSKSKMIRTLVLLDSVRTVRATLQSSRSNDHSFPNLIAIFPFRKMIFSTFHLLLGRLYLTARLRNAIGLALWNLGTAMVVSPFFQGLLSRVPGPENLPRFFANINQRFNNAWSVVFESISKREKVPFYYDSCSLLIPELAPRISVKIELFSCLVTWIRFYFHLLSSRKRGLIEIECPHRVSPVLSRFIFKTHFGVCETWERVLWIQEQKKKQIEFHKRKPCFKSFLSV